MHPVIIISNLLEQIWEKGEAAIRQLQKPLVARKVRRDFESAYDDVQAKIAEKESENKQDYRVKIY